MSNYTNLLEDEIFKHGSQRGSLKTALTVLTDMLVELNALELYYQKPISKSVAPSEIAGLRMKIDAVKRLLHDSLEIEG